MAEYDAIVVGAGPNGLAAAIVLARAGWHVLVREAGSTIGGGARSGALTLPGFVHDVCSAVHPLAAASPFMRSLPLEAHGLCWIESPASLAHPLDDGPPAMLYRSIVETAAGLGRDGERYRALLAPFVDRWPAFVDEVLAPPIHWPRHPLLYTRFGLGALRSAVGLARSRFRDASARALFAGNGAHSGIPLTALGSAAFGIVLTTLGHAVGWPIPAGGTSALVEAMASYLRSLGGEIICDAPVRSLAELPRVRATLLDITPAQLAKIGGDALSSRYRTALARYEYGPAVFKVDWALSGPVPWRSAECARAITVHVGGTDAEIARSERAAKHGEHADRPFVLVAQPSLFDPSRAPAGKHTLWGYCHVPLDSTVDMTDAIERQIERFAPGFRDVILARSVRGPATIEAENANRVGGDISGGSNTLRQVFFRPTVSLIPYRTPMRGIYLCSASTPPGGGVHGMCGFNAAQRVLEDAGAADR